MIRKKLISMIILTLIFEELSNNTVIDTKTEEINPTDLECTHYEKLAEYLRGYELNGVKFCTEPNKEI